MAKHTHLSLDERITIQQMLGQAKSKNLHKTLDKPWNLRLNNFLIGQLLLPVFCLLFSHLNWSKWKVGQAGSGLVKLYLML